MEKKNTWKIHDLMLARISPLVINLLVLGFLSLDIWSTYILYIVADGKAKFRNE